VTRRIGDRRIARAVGLFFLSVGVVLPPVMCGVQNFLGVGSGYLLSRLIVFGGSRHTWVRRRVLELHFADALACMGGTEASSRGSIRSTRRLGRWASIRDPWWFARLRRTARLVRMASTLGVRPAGRITQVFRTSAERQGAYDLLSNEIVDHVPLVRSMGPRR